MPEVNVALIGHRFMGKAHSNAFRQVASFFPGNLKPRLKVLCSRQMTPELEATARQYGWEEVDCDWRRVVERKDIDIVDVATPGNLHAPMAIAAAQAGKHVICEKPLANTLVEAKAMLKAVEKAGVTHMVMFNYRRIPAIAFAKRLIDDGKIGDVYHYRGFYLQDWIMDPDFPMVWRLDKKIAGSGAMGDLGAHVADLAEYLNGELTTVTGQLTTFIKERPLASGGEGAWGAKGTGGKGKVTVDDSTNFMGRFKNGSVGVFETTRFAGGRRNYNNVEIYGSKGSIAFNLERMNELQFFDRTEPGELQGYKTIMVTQPNHPYVGNWWPPGHIIGYEHTFVHAIHDFLTAIDEGRQPEPNFRHGVRNQAVLETIESSSKSGRWEKVKA